MFRIVSYTTLNLLFLKLLKTKFRFLFSNIFCLCGLKNRNALENGVYFHLYYSFHEKSLYLFPFSTRLHSQLFFLNEFLTTSHIQNWKIGKCKKYVNFFFYKILVYKFLRFVTHFWEIAIENFKEDTLCPLSPLGVKASKSILQKFQVKTIVESNNCVLEYTNKFFFSFYLQI